MNESKTSSPSFIGRFFSPRTLRRVFLLLAALATIIGLFYTEENLRGKHAWKRFKQESARRGIDANWMAFIPPPVPDDENFFKAPDMQKWFTGRGQNDLSRLLNYEVFDEMLLRRGLVPAVEVVVVPANSPGASDYADLVMQYHRPLLSLADSTDPDNVKPGSKPASGRVQISAAALKRMKEAFAAKVEACKPPELSPRLTDVNLRPMSLKPLPQLQPLRILVRTDGDLNTNQMKEFLPLDIIDLTPYGLGIVFTETNVLRAPLVKNPPRYSVADYLAWSDGFADKFNAMRAALDRPYARMEGDYEHPSTIPIPNFVCARMVAQMLALRAQCYLLRGEPDKALNELTLLHHMSRMFEGRPTSQPMTLIAAMINTAVRGLYVDIIGDGFQLRAWREPQLAVLQRQLAETDLLPYLQNSLQMEFTSFGQTVEVSSQREMEKMFSNVKISDHPIRSRLQDPTFLYLRFAPRGWLYQNAVSDAALGEAGLASMDVTNHLVFPRKVEENVLYLEKQLKHSSPYNYLAKMFIPNFLLAKQRAVYNQTLVNEAMIVCALERFHLSTGHYPDTLDTLVPAFVDKLPHDLIGGAPLKYRNEGERFVLYSIGWNEKDDGGVTIARRENISDYTKQDWAWPF